MTGRLAGTVETSSLVSSLALPRTRRSFSSGMYFDTGSSSRSLPCSTSVITAVQVIGLVIEAIAKIVSSVIGALLARSR